MIKRVKKRKTIMIFLLIMFCSFIAIMLFSTRTQMHVDEIWSYMLSNNYEKPFLYVHTVGVGGDTSLEDGNIFNLKAQETYQAYFTHWHNNEYYLNSITVQPNEQFAYDTVYRNQEMDVHPPLYYFFLHSICSFFLNKFSTWFAMALNLAFYVGCLYFIYLISRKLLCSNYLAIITMLFWGLSSSGLNEVVFLRMYMMLTFWILCTTYLHILLIRNFNWYHVILIAFFNTLGFLTQYYSYIYVFFITLLTSILLISKKQWFKVIYYGFSVLFSVGLAILIFPATIKHVFSSTWTSSVTNALPRIKTDSFFYMLELVFQSYTGFLFPKNILISVFWIIVLMIFIYPLIKLIQKQGNLKIDISVFRLIGYSFNECYKGKLMKTWNATSLEFKIVLFSLLFASTTIAHLSPNMGALTIRYLFLLLPLFSIFIVFYIQKLAFWFTEKFRKNTSVKKIIFAVIVVFIILSNVPGSYFIRNLKGSDNNFSEKIVDKNIIIVDGSHHSQTFSLAGCIANSIYPADQLDETVINEITNYNFDVPLFLVVNSEIHKKEIIEKYLSQKSEVAYNFVMKFYYSTDAPNFYYLYELSPT